ncbi:MAG: AbrB/MazE/SpoVT family DNA-binding domain-containing protein [Desulfobulbaceae bacterium]|nr:AbrB/MazE/SpoVT family DNA-binding domain-containing protein [Desulfobulbaceae bacterium]
MKASIIKIGNSQGIRLPKPIIEQCGFNKEVELEVHNHEVVIRPIIRHPRHNWENAFKAMAANGDDKLLESPATKWDEEEWEWE